MGAALAVDLARYLGAGRVVRLAEGADRALVVALEDGTLVRATPAFTYPYVPTIGDELLVVGDAAAFFLIGVLDGRGGTALDDPRGLAIAAEGGRLRVIGDRGVAITGRQVDVIAERFARTAVTAKQTFDRVATTVRELLAVDAGEVDELGKGAFRLAAKRVVMKALVGVRMKGSTVRLG